MSNSETILIEDRESSTIVDDELQCSEKDESAKVLKLVKVRI